MTDIQKRLEKLRKAIPDPSAVAGRWIFFFRFSSRQAKGDARNHIPPPSGPFSRYQLRHGKRLMEDLARICR